MHLQDIYLDSSTHLPTEIVAFNSHILVKFTKIAEKLDEPQKLEVEIIGRISTK